MGRVWVHLYRRSHPGVSTEPHERIRPRHPTELLREKDAERIAEPPAHSSPGESGRLTRENRRIIAGHHPAAYLGAAEGPGEPRCRPRNRLREDRRPGPAQTTPERATSRPWWRKIFDR